MNDRTYLESLLILGSIVRRSTMPIDQAPKVLPLARGKIKPAKFRNGFGFIAPDDKGVDVYFKIDAGRKIVVGLTEPEFSDDHLDRLPGDNDRVIYRPQAYVNPGVRSTRQKFQAVVWGFENDYEAAKHIIDLRPVYRIIQTTCYKGRPVSVNPDKEMIVGTRETILTRFSNGFPKGVLDHSYIYRLEVCDGDKWKPVVDESVIRVFGLSLPSKIALTRGKEAKDFRSLAVVSSCS